MNSVGRISEAAHALFYGVTLFSLAGTMQVIQISSFILRPFSESLIVKINSELIGTVWKVMQFIFESRKKAKITFSGDRLPLGENALVISNHVSWTDVYLIHAVANRSHMLKNCKYFIKDSLKWIPFFGWGMWLAGFIFVRRNWTQDQDKIISSFDKIKRLGSPAWIINYVEGSRLTPKKLSEAQAFSKERNYPVLNNLLLPRVKGFASCVRQLRKTHVQYVYDLTLAYRQKAPSILRVHTRSLTPEYEFHVHVQRYAIQDLPLDETEMGHWLRYLWLEKDRRLSELNEHWIDSIDPKDIWT